MDKKDVAVKLLEIVGNEDYCMNMSDFWWRTDTEYAPITMFVNCNDFFWWGCADCEDVTAENIHLLEEVAKECEEIQEYSSEHAPLIFCARVRGERPQGAYYDYFPKSLWPLLDACGEERETGFGNPYKPGERSAKKAASENVDK